MMLWMLLLLAQAGWRAEVDRLKSRGDAEGALAILEKQPRTSALEDEAGFLLAALKRRPEAIGHFREAIRLMPANGSAHYHLGVALWLEGERAEAVRRLAEATVRAAGIFESLERYAFAARENGERGLALEAFRRTVALKPDCLACRNSLSFLLIDQGFAAKGRAEAEAVLAKEPKNLAALSNLGFAYLQQNELAKAIGVYQRALEIAPESAAMQYNLGLSYKQKDDLERARTHLGRALALDPRMIEAHYTLGIVHWQSGEFDEAERHFGEAVRESPEYADGWAMYGTVLRQKGLKDQAKVALERAARLKPEDPGPYSQLAQLLRSDGDAEGARRYLAEAAAKKAAKEAMQKEMFDRSSLPRPKAVQ